LGVVFDGGMVVGEVGEIRARGWGVACFGVGGIGNYGIAR
jgi:hypothetical protein